MDPYSEFRRMWKMDQEWSYSRGERERDLETWKRGCSIVTFYLTRMGGAVDDGHSVVTSFEFSTEITGGGENLLVLPFNAEGLAGALEQANALIHKFFLAALESYCLSKA